MAARNPRTSTPAETPPDARGQFVLGEIIREHLRTGEPVGSKAVAERCANSAGWSAATIRNVMADLEDAGLVAQPHTSAGRVPTDQGYRFYVDHIVGAARLAKNDLDAIDRALGAGLSADGEGQGRLMERVSHLLSELSENVGIVVSPPLAERTLQHIEFVALADGRVLAVMVFAPNVVQHKVVRVGEPLEQEELERAARYVNAEFTGKSLNAIRAELLRAVLAEKVLYDRLLRNAVLLCDQSLDGGPEDAGEVYVDGASNILSKPDFADITRLRELFRTLEEKSRLIELLNECVGRGDSPAMVSVRIGRELASPAMQACALISAPYRTGAADGFGALGVFGPMRIEYARTMAVVNYVAQRVGRVLGEGGRVV